MTHPIFTCQNVNIKMGYKFLLTKINFMIFSGEMIALVGPNGVGKTSLLKSACGLLTPDSGAFLCGEKIKPFYWRHTPAFFLDLSLLENIYFYCKSFFIPIDNDRIEKALDIVNLRKKANYTVRQLSTGQKKRLQLATLLIVKPHLIFADEPTNDLDKQGFELCIQIFQDLCKKNQSGILVATHDDGLINICDKSIDLSEFHQQKPTTQKHSTIL